MRFPQSAPRYPTCPPSGKRGHLAPFASKAFDHQRVYSNDLLSTGKIIKKTLDAVVISCAGSVTIPRARPPVAGALPGVGQQATLYTIMNVTENDVSLYGFATEEQQATASDADRRHRRRPQGRAGHPQRSWRRSGWRWPSSRNTRPFKAAAGVGPKLAQRIVLELKDKVVQGSC